MEPINILIVTDAQVDFCTGSLGTREAVESVPAIVQKIEDAKKEKVIIFATKDTHGSDYLETSEGKHLPVVHTVKDTAGWEFIPEIKRALAGYPISVVEKDRFGSFKLEERIRLKTVEMGRNVMDGQDLVITLVGWCTDICVVSNAIILKAAFPEARIIVDSKCCAGVTPELHDAALKVMASCQIEII